MTGLGPDLKKNERVHASSVTGKIQQGVYPSVGDHSASAQTHNLSVSGTTPKVQYSYANGSTNTIRPTTLTYPNGRATTIGYGTSGGINDSASRVDGLIDGATALVNYAYLGLGTTVQTTYPQPSLQYTLLGSSSGTSPAGDIYWGLDQFGRIIDSRWYRTTTSVDIDRIKYGYDRASNRIWRQNPVATAASAQYDELYTNDGLQRLKDMQRGTLNGTNTAIPSPTFAQCWTLDPTGNWRGFNESTTGSAWTMTQTRASNKVNEITGITTSVGLAWATPAYDAAGNMTSVPRTVAIRTNFTAVYDAWNRLMSIKAGATDIQQYQYDARNFRTVILTYTSGVLSETRHSYFTSNWRCIEERTGTSTTAELHFIWGARYIDDIVLRDRDTTGGGTLNERLYAVQDANWNVTALTTSAALVGERIAYTPYGRPVFMSAAYGTRSTSAFAWETLFCGYRFDAVTQLYSVRNRSYHPAVGGWMQRDPIGYSKSINVYLYTSEAPLSRVDPKGLEDELCDSSHVLTGGVGAISQANPFFTRRSAAPAASIYESGFRPSPPGSGAPAEMTFGTDSNWIPVSTKQLGAQGINGELYYINRRTLDARGTPEIPPAELAGMVRDCRTTVPRHRRTWPLIQNRPSLLSTLQEPFEQVVPGATRGTRLWQFIRGGEQEAAAYMQIPPDSIYSRNYGYAYNGLRVTGLGLTVYAAANTGINVTSAASVGAKTGDWTPLRETTVVDASAWTGAMAGGLLGAEIGAAGGPIGCAGGGLVGGFAGGVGGSAVGQGINDAARNAYNHSHATWNWPGGPWGGWLSGY